MIDILYLKVESFCYPPKAILFSSSGPKIRSIERRSVFSHSTDPSIFMSEPEADGGYSPHNDVLQLLGA